MRVSTSAARARRRRRRRRGADYNASQDVLVQWDHGAPGVAAALLRGWRALGTARYLHAAEKALELTWRRGLLTKGLMTCHGISGNTWMQLYAAKTLGSAAGAKYAYRALQFQALVLAHPILSQLDQMRVMQVRARRHRPPVTRCPAPRHAASRGACCTARVIHFTSLRVMWARAAAARGGVEFLDGERRVGRLAVGRPAASRAVECEPHGVGARAVAARQTV